MQFENYIVKDGQAVPENPHSRNSKIFDGFSCLNDLIDNQDWQAFETWKQCHTYATDAPDGVYFKERFEIVWQRRIKLYTEPETWVDILDGQASAYKNHETPRQTDLRQFARLIKEVEKGEESAQLTIGDTSFTKLSDGFIQILTKNCCVQLMPDEIEQLTKFIKQWQSNA